MLNIGWFSTGRDKAARDLLQITKKHISNDEIKGKIIFTFCNREPGESKETDQYLQLVNNYKIPSVFFSSDKFKNTVTTEQPDLRRIAYDRLVMAKLSAWDPDICILAGYMLIVGEEMCRKFKMINLHPATPEGPKGTWQEVIWNLIENNAVTSGVMIHLVTPELDRGPVVTYCTYPIKGDAFDKYWASIKNKSITDLKKFEGEHNKLFMAIREAGLKREFPLIVITLKTICNGDIRIENNSIVNKSGKLVNGYDLTDEVNKMAGIV